MCRGYQSFKWLLPAELLPVSKGSFSENPRCPLNSFTDFPGEGIFGKAWRHFCFSYLKGVALYPVNGKRAQIVYRTVPINRIIQPPKSGVQRLRNPLQQQMVKKEGHRAASGGPVPLTQNWEAGAPGLSGPSGRCSFNAPQKHST